ncbi:HipA N-terminal domain-containing protein [Lutibacter sp.]|uniref:HipA N-terminal domain-containing protein n=1 Tax=Lutibacter sp. TaxID=1925666 RepID=UPI0025C54AF1|nr:HipA N-terminal domain-containing protein [Lutibacter sp.]MCF6182310.1 HipA N-terminal domain-containing protein [Lutibacter sp.]
MKRAKIYMYDFLAGILIEDDEGYHFQYEKEYLKMRNSEPISLTLPLTDSTYNNKVLFPFFDGLIPEGWLLDIAEKNWKINVRDRMSILLVTCRDCIGAVSVYPIENE